jgi:hypothetical protein
VLAEGKRLKHLKEKAHHKILYCELSFFVEDGPTTDATDAPQPQGVRCNLTMKTMTMMIIFVLFLVMEHRWNEIDREDINTRGKNCPNATLSTTNPTWTDLGSNPCLRGGRLEANRLSHGTALNHKLHQRANCLRIFLCYFISL